MNATTQRALLRSMMRIREVEETIAARYHENKMRCPTHLCTGQEAVAAAVGLALRPDDFAVSTHRAHGHYLGKNGDLPRMMAEIYGKRTGCSAGKGGSMHLIDTTVGFMGSTAIVGNTVPIGVGLALSITLRGTDQVSCVFLGDAVVEEGVFFESVNFAVLHSLPVLFVCENNLYSVYSSLRVRQPGGRSIAGMVAGLGIETRSEDGTDALATYTLAASAVDDVRAERRPLFLEYSTYRWREHCGPNFDNDIGYRTVREFEDWQERDPLERLITTLRDDGRISDAQVSGLREEIRREIDSAFAFAERSPFPPAADLFDHVYGGGAS